MSNVRDLIDAIEAGKSVAIQRHFEEIMMDKMISAIEQRKHDIAQNLMQSKTEEDDSHGS